MELLSFINTNIGIVAVRRHIHAENRYYSQVWVRMEPGVWQKRHLDSRECEEEYGPGMLEALYRGVPEGELPREDWW